MRNKTIISVLALVVIVSGVSLIVATKQTVFAQQTTTNFLPYVNSTYGIKLQYPSSWDKEENGTRQAQKLTLLHSLLPL